ncbi:MAG: flagellar FliJ family protein [Blastocatellia bacterium]|nr:flagellar FliJ family protein [Blastocatellia bacterium]MBN8723646.1 flagellar FliJ family protein [Acidobacteriota bacterium]
MSKVKYRLQPILDEKERLREDAIQFLNKKKDELKAEEKKLEQIKEELTAAIERKNQMTQEYNDKMFSGKYTVDEIKIRKIHIEDMISKIEEIKQAVENQRKAVARAEGEVRKAEDALIAASKEVQVMEKHKENWHQALKEEERKKEAKQLEEIAQIMYTSAKMNRQNDDF